MDRRSQSPIWPFLLVVGFLFLLCIFAPREWERIAREQPVRFSARRPAALPLEQEMAAVAPDDEPAVSGESADAILNAEAAPTFVEPTAEAQASTPPVVEPTPHLSEEPAQAADVASEATRNIERPSAPSAEVTSDVTAEVTSGERRAVDADRMPELAHLRTGTAADEPAAEVSGQPVLEPEPAPAQQRPVSKPRTHLAMQPRTVILEESTEAEQPTRHKPTAAVARTGPQWAVPDDLLRRLEALACECDCTDWSMRVEELLLKLCDQTTPADERSSAILSELRTAAGEVDARVPQIAERSVAIELLRVRHSLVRRLEVWELMPAAFSQRITVAGPSQSDIKRLAAALDAVDGITSAAGAEGQQWRRYLALDSLRSLTKTPCPLADSEARQLGRDVQGRLSRTDLSDGQRAFISSRPVAELTASLRPWSLDPFDPARLLADLEHFEATNQPSDARRVADDYIESISLVHNGADLAQRLESNYRNANVRLALTEKLLKRLLPGASMSTDPVRDQILGHPTRGTSTTSTTVDVKLVPDGQRLRVELEASGQVLANTRSTSGPATLHTQSNSMYLARKLVDLDLRGIRTWPAESECIDTRTQLRAVNTDYDGIPLVGAMVENFVRSRHADQESEVRSEVRRRVESQARRKMDALTEERLERVNRILQERVLRPLDRLALDPQVISAETSEQRLTMRLRVAGEEQLAGHTPRPRAPGDSLLSLQIHQSLFNNICEQLQLAGRTFTLQELRDHINKSLNLENSRFMDAADEDVTITFANQDAIRVFCEHGRIELDLDVARLSNAERTWKNFQVRVFYRPEIDGLQARLVRDGTVQLIGSRLAGQIPLRGIFSKAFAKDRELNLVDPKWSTDERTHDLAFSQFVIQDGWIAVAVAEPRQNVARQPQPATGR
jgi:hypothetical protein